jgi:hypothetical protein
MSMIIVVIPVVNLDLNADVSPNIDVNMIVIRKFKRRS